MSARYKILLLDDDQDLLQLYQEILGRLQSKPEIYTATSGARAIALLEAEPFTLLISDLSMPKMDGLQVLTCVRRKFPQLRTAVLTCVVDEQFRARAYAIGVDIFLEKPGTPQEINLFLDCIESLLGQETQSGFRGVQSKSLVDIVQLECLSQSSSVLKVTNGAQEGRIWFQDGDVIQAECGELGGVPAFHKILAWKTGNFEILASEPGRERKIFESYHGLLLQSAQAQDEARGPADADGGPGTEPGRDSAVPALASFSRLKGVEFVLTAQGEAGGKHDSWGVESPDLLAAWTRSTLQQFQSLGDRLQAGQLAQVEGYGMQSHVALSPRRGVDLCVGFNRSLSAEQLRETMKDVLIQWAS